MSFTITLANEDHTALLGSALAPLLSSALNRPELKARALSVFLQGDLGAGKTFLTRSILRALGYEGTVKSPTYTIVESYILADLEFFHFDLYRLHDPEELELMGIRDYFAKRALCLIEWPDRGETVLNKPDMIIEITHLNQGRKVAITSDLISESDWQAIADRFSA